MLEELPFRKAGEINKLVQGAREKGAAGMTTIGQLFGQLGLGELGTGGQIAGATVEQGQKALENQQQQAAAMGSAIGGLIALLVGA